MVELAPPHRPYRHRRSQARVRQPPLLDRLATAAKICQAFGAILALITPLVLAVINLTVSRYLAAFGQPGLSSFGEVASFSVAVLPWVLLIVIAVVGFAALPAAARLIADTSGEHAFAAAYHWPRPGESGLGRSIGCYLILHAVPLTVSLLLILSLFIPDPPLEALGCVLPLITALVIAIGLARATRLNLARGRGRDPYANTVMVAIFASLSGATWLVIIAQATLSLLTPRLVAFDDPTTIGIAAAVIVALTLLHLIATQLDRTGSIVLGALLGMALLAGAGHQDVLSLSLRMANLGGGAPIAYRPSETFKSGAPRTACLILAAGDTRIVWLPFPAKGQVLATCDRALFNAAFQQGARAVALDRLGAAADVRVFKREDLYDEP